MSAPSIQSGSASVGSAKEEGGTSNAPEGLQFLPADHILFKGPFNRPSKTSIQVVNNTDQPFVFKVMITEPRRYLIRPNYALIEAGSAVEVQAQMRALPGPKALDHLLATRQKLLFKWRPLKKTPSEDENYSPESGKKSNGSNRAQENPSALFITCTTPITETAIYIHFEPPPLTPTSTPEGSQGVSGSLAFPEGGGSSFSAAGGRSSSLAGAPGTAIEEDPSGGLFSTILTPLSSSPGMIISTSALVLLIAILVAIAYMFYIRQSGGSGDGSQDGSQRFLRRYIF